MANSLRVIDPFSGEDPIMFLGIRGDDGVVVLGPYETLKKSRERRRYLVENLKFPYPSGLGIYRIQESDLRAEQVE